MPKPTIQEIEQAERLLTERWSKKAMPSGEVAIGVLGETPFQEDAYCWDVYANRRWDKVHQPSISPGYGGLGFMKLAGRAYYIGTFLRFALHDLKAEIDEKGIYCIPEVQNTMHIMRERGVLATYFDDEDLDVIKTCMRCFRELWPEFEDEEQMFFVDWPIW